MTAEVGEPFSVIAGIVVAATDGDVAPSVQRHGGAAIAERTDQMATASALHREGEPGAYLATALGDEPRIDLAAQPQRQIATCRHLIDRLRPQRRVNLGVAANLRNHGAT